MHSLKNTIIAVGLLGLSFVFYQMSAPDQNDFAEIDEPVITDLRAELAEASPVDRLKLPSLQGPSPIKSESGLSNSFASLKTNEFSLPSPKITNPLASPMAEPKLTPPAMTSPKSSFDTAPPKFKPRPEAKFDFTGESGPALAPPAGVVQRDQSLVNALKAQQNATSGSVAKVANTFQLNPYHTQAAVPAQSASFIRDSSVVTASKIDNVDVSNGFGLQPAKSASSDPYAGLNFEEVWPVVEKLVKEERFRKSLQLLTRFYGNPGLSGPQNQRLDGWLDGLASKVIFSNEHHLSPAYVFQPGDSLLELGRQWGVPGELIYNVNRARVPNPMMIEPGTELKKITGPINASVDLSSNTMTLFVDEMYAGRFNLIVGTSGSPGPGNFKVMGKLPAGHDWRDSSGVYPPGHQNNHYGKYWIALEGSLCMHSVAPGTNDGHLGCLGLSEKDALDVFSILSDDSVVSIK